MLRAVTFDWGDTLMRDAWDEDVAREGALAGLAALGAGSDLPDVDRIGAWWGAWLAEVDPRREDELNSLEETRRCFRELGLELSDDELTAYSDAFHQPWERSLAISPHAHALLEALRERDLKLAVISNVVTPGRIIRGFLERQGFTERVDTVVLSCEVGKRKPHPAIFERTLDELGVAPGEALHVGDRGYHDVQGAREVGMGTVQALWFYVDDAAEGMEPDYEAFTMFDVLNIVDQVAAQ